MAGPSHYTITLPVEVAGQLQEESNTTKTPRSTLIAKHLKQYYDTGPTVDFETKIQALKEGYEAQIQELKTTSMEHGRRHTVEIQETRAEIQQVKEIRSQSACPRHKRCAFPSRSYRAE